MNRNTKTERNMDTSVLDGIYIMEIDENFAETVIDTMMK